MGNSYKEDCLEAKRKREGIHEQRESVPSKKKKIEKNWVVYWSIWGGNGSAKNFATYKFVLEKDAVSYAEKINRRFASHRLPKRMSESVWVVNDGAERND